MLLGNSSKMSVKSSIYALHSRSIIFLILSAFVGIKCTCEIKQSDLERSNSPNLLNHLSAAECKSYFGPEYGVLVLWLIIFISILSDLSDSSVLINPSAGAASTIFLPYTSACNFVNSSSRSLARRWFLIANLSIWKCSGIWRSLVWKINLKISQEQFTLS